jgi:hypothetical protein
MTPHPVQLHIEVLPVRRVQVLVRLVLLAALSALGCSSLYWVLYLALPVVAALLVSRDGPERYLASDSGRIVRALRWLASAYAYLWLLTDAVPGATDERGGPVDLDVATGGTPTATSALLRLVTTLPALLLLLILSLATAVFWVFAAIAVVTREQVPAAIRDFITMTLRFQFRVVAYHLSLVDTYPVPGEPALPHEPHSPHSRGA